MEHMQEGDHHEHHNHHHTSSFQDEDSNEEHENFHDYEEFDDDERERNQYFEIHGIHHGSEIVPEEPQNGTTEVHEMEEDMSEQKKKKKGGLEKIEMKMPKESDLEMEDHKSEEGKADMEDLSHMDHSVFVPVLGVDDADQKNKSEKAHINENSEHETAPHTHDHENEGMTAPVEGIEAENVLENSDHEANLHNITAEHDEAKTSSDEMKIVDAGRNSTGQPEVVEEGDIINSLPLDEHTKFGSNSTIPVKQKKKEPRFDEGLVSSTEGMTKDGHGSVTDDPLAFSDDGLNEGLPVVNVSIDEAAKKKPTDNQDDERLNKVQGTKTIQLPVSESSTNSAEMESSTSHSSSHMMNEDSSSETTMEHHDTKVSSTTEGTEENNINTTGDSGKEDVEREDKKKPDGSDSKGIAEESNPDTPVASSQDENAITSKTNSSNGESSNTILGNEPFSTEHPLFPVQTNRDEHKKEIKSVEPVKNRTEGDDVIFSSMEATTVHPIFGEVNTTNDGTSSNSIVPAIRDEGEEDEISSHSPLKDGSMSGENDAETTSNRNTASVAEESGTESVKSSETTERTLEVGNEQSFTENVIAEENPATSKAQVSSVGEGIVENHQETSVENKTAHDLPSLLAGNDESENNSFDEEEESKPDILKEFEKTDVKKKDKKSSKEDSSELTKQFFEKKSKSKEKTTVRSDLLKCQKRYFRSSRSHTRSSRSFHRNFRGRWIYKYGRQCSQFWSR
ncbi:hypothetical protein LSTR_LSTR014918 [Laodelphax striatellus]|uniref:Uncharacterized protein n=1 Tax=Laodelphax striatellus TaxID=195883 RepID=A0A482X315_LAOST|nr:hypothetical protein LSTR_LSTR014918 [Laodelphax striatellus]